MLLFILLLFIGAILCFIIKENFLMFFVGLELLFLAINLQFIFFSLDLEEFKGFFVAILLIIIAAIDTAIGLSLLLKYHNVSGQISIISLSNLKVDTKKYLEKLPSLMVGQSISLAKYGFEPRGSI